jgi:hypothetical protein
MGAAGPGYYHLGKSISSLLFPFPFLVQRKHLLELLFPVLSLCGRKYGIDWLETREDEERRPASDILSRTDWAVSCRLKLREREREREREKERETSHGEERTLVVAPPPPP